MMMSQRGPGWVMQAKSNAHVLDIFTFVSQSMFADAGHEEGVAREEGK